jgi:type VI secretion system secreted protein VgrG
VEGGVREEFRIHEWQKAQELRSGKYTLWDHCFELPHKHLEADLTIPEAVPVGKVTHKLKVGDNEKLEIYHYPGGYAQRFDGVDKSGAPRPADLEKIYQDNKRTVAIRMLEEAGAGLVIHGVGNCRQFVTGHKFTLERHFNADGQYLLTGLQHSAKMAGGFHSGGDTTFDYSNRFTCLPLALPFRPPRTTPRPRVQGTQTALVVGPMGKEEIFTDKYGRVKVQFHWDREGKYNQDSSCWIRVATAWAGKGWGQINIPRIGHEVIVDFLEGDPDNPIIVGSVYNAENMPAKKLPEGRKTCGLVTRSNESLGKGFNQITCDDTGEKEKIIIHGQYDLKADILHDENWTVKNDCNIKILEGKYTHDVVANTADYHVQGKLTEKVDNVQETWVALDVFLQSKGGNIREEAKSGEFYVFANKAVEVKSDTNQVHILAKTEILLEVGKSKLLLKSNGDIELSGINVAIKGASHVRINGGEIISQADNVHSIGGGKCVSEATGTNTVKGMFVLLNP